MLIKEKNDAVFSKYAIGHCILLQLYYFWHLFSLQVLVHINSQNSKLGLLVCSSYPCRIRHYVESMQMLCHKAMQNLC